MVHDSLVTIHVVLSNSHLAQRINALVILTRSADRRIWVKRVDFESSRAELGTLGAFEVGVDAAAGARLELRARFVVSMR